MKLSKSSVGFIAASGVLFLIMMGIVFGYPKRFNHDVALHLLSASHIWEGHTPYVDFFNINFPMIFYIDLIPVVLSRLTGLSLILAYHLMLLVMIALSTSLIMIITLQFDEAHHGSKLIFGIMLGSLLVVMNNDLGQREHLFMLLYFPFALLRWYEWRDREVSLKLGIPAAILGAVGVCIKPFFAVPVLAIEGYWLVTRRNQWRKVLTPAALTFAGVGILYLLHLAIVPGLAEGFRIQLERSLSGYGAARGSTPPLDLLFSVQLPLLVAIGVVILAHQHDTVREKLLLWLAVLCVSTVVSYALQRRGFNYQTIPAVMTTILLVTLLLFPKRPENAGWSIGLMVGRVFVGLWLFYAFFQPSDWQAVASSEDQLADLREVIVTESRSDESVLVLSTHVPTFRVILQTERPSATRYLPSMPVLFDLPRDIPLAEQYRTVTPWIEEFLTTTQADIQTTPPEIILVNNHTTCPSCPANLNLHTYLESVGFLAESVYPTYMRLGEIDGYIVYDHVGTPNSAMQVPVNFGPGQVLTAWEMPTGPTVPTCGAVTFQSWWEARDFTGQYFSLSAVLANDAQGVIGRVNGPPAGIETLDWQLETRYADERTIEIACDTPPGEYQLLLTLEDPLTQTQQPVELANGQPVGEFFVVTTLTITE